MPWGKKKKFTESAEQDVRKAEAEIQKFIDEHPDMGDQELLRRVNSLAVRADMADLTLNQIKGRRRKKPGR